MNQDTLTPGKLYYTIGEVSEYLKLAPSQIRFWETQFPELSPKKTRKGDRRYILKDVETLEKINHLLKIQGFTIKGAKEHLKTIKGREIPKIEAPTQELSVQSVESSVTSPSEMNPMQFSEFTEMLNKMHDFRNALMDVRDALIVLRNQIK
jgi:DNA-binding transcriptional MerR regulator